MDTSGKKNVLLILCDQLRADFLGCYGGPQYTPNIDSLASNGVTFSRAYCCAPVCTSSRAALLTGKLHPLTCSNQIPDETPLLPDQLTAAGWYTACLGKMHMFPIRGPYGFNELCLSEDFPIHMYCDDYHPELAEQGHYEYANGLDVFDIIPGRGLLPENKTVTHWNGKKAVEFIRRQRQSAQPFYSVVSFVKPHPPFDPIQKYIDMIDPDDIPVCMPMREQSDYPDVFQQYWEVYGDNEFKRLDVIKQIRHYYLALIAQIDEQIGRIIDALKENDLYDDTVIVFSADHGEFLGDHHLFMKFFGYEPAARIPLIISDPGVTEEKTVSTAVSNIDLVPTILDYCDLPIPETCDGQSLLPLINGNNINRTGVPVSMCVDNGYCWVTDEHKYILYQNGQEELFDLIGDPYEKENLVNENPDLRKQLFADLTSELRRLQGRQIGVSRPLIEEDAPYLEGDKFPAVDMLKERFMQHRHSPELFEYL